MKSGFVNYCRGANFAQTDLTLPLKGETNYLRYGGNRPYGGISLGLSVCFELLPAFARVSLSSVFEDVPTFAQNVAETLRLISALDETQESLGGKVNGVLLTGLDFLAQIAKEYGIFLEYKGAGS